jgi:hypothetical protein
MPNRKGNPPGIRAEFPLLQTRAYRSGDILILTWRDKRVVLTCSAWHTAETQGVCRKKTKTKTDEIFQKPSVFRIMPRIWTALTQLIVMTVRIFFIHLSSGGGSSFPGAGCFYCKFLPSLDSKADDANKKSVTHL